MTNYQSQAGGADVQQHYLNKQVNIFLFDLKNEALEHGLKNNESWSLELVNEAEMKNLRRNHHPIISLKLQPQALLNVYQQVKLKLLQALSAADAALTVNELTNNEKKHLAAYPVRSIRK